MTLEEKLEKFKSGTAALHTPTREVFGKLMTELERLGYRWCTGEFPTNNLWDRWKSFREYTCVNNCLAGMYYDSREYFEAGNVWILEITEEDFAAPSETVESVVKSIEEVKADLEFYRELFKKYNVVMAGNLEPTMREILESLLKKRVVS